MEYFSRASVRKRAKKAFFWGILSVEKAARTQRAGLRADPPVYTISILLAVNTDGMGADRLHVR
jgi:hypothetical protein